MQTFLRRIKRNLKNSVAFFSIVARTLLKLLDFFRVYGIEQVSHLRPWIQGQFRSPAPNIVKWSLMERWGGNAIWIETGTYLGETTMKLAQGNQFVISIEPEISLFINAERKFRNAKNVVLLNGTSELKLLEAINLAKEKDEEDISFWLDGHFSEGLTYLGDTDSPIVFELNMIATELSDCARLTILIDDVRSFSATNRVVRGYPSLTYLVEYADTNRWFWTIEHDIFIMTNRNMNS